MAQQRYVNFGDTVLAQRINEISTALVVPAVLSGAEMTVGLGGKSVDIHPHKVMLNDLLLTEDAIVNLFVPTPPATTLPVDPTDYTVVYEHTNQQVQGGVPALLFVREGLIGFDSLPNTVVVGWIRWTGTGTRLKPEMFIEAPKLQITNPTEFPADTIVPPFVPRIYIRSEVPAGTNDIVDVFDDLAFEAGDVGAAHMSITNSSPSLSSTLKQLFPFVAGLEAPNRVIIEANVPLGGSVSVSLVDEDGTEYLPVDLVQGKITNTAAQYEFREVSILNVDITKFAQNRPYYVQVVTQLNAGKEARVSIVGASSNFLPV